jgi:hypothetical protein
VLVAKKDVPMLKQPRASCHWRPCSLSSLEAVWKKSLLGGIFIGTLLTRVSSISVITSTCVQRACLPPCSAAVQRQAGLSPKVWWVNDLQVSQEGKPTGLECCAPWCW